MRRARLILLAGTVLYSAWLIAPLLGSQLSPLTSYLSEIGAVGQPHARFFRTTDVLAGTTFVLAAALAHRAGRPTSRLAVIGLAGLALLGAATVGDALLPLSCTPTTDAACAARELAGEVPWTHVGHAVSSGIAGFGGVVAVLAWALWRRSCAGGTGFDGARLALGLGVLFLLSTAWTLAAMLEPALYLGLAQRTQVVTLTLWLAWIAMSPRAQRPPAPNPGGRDTPHSPRPPTAAAGPWNPDHHGG
ncbi:DUF998 domain-containing protein [Tsukamurella sputi]|uniref:DUF998 domain-containing protein n=1 Tax=Tsukamurella sputi TaxID=2591848 RepID=A0A5C5RIN0_9ACTN|nr:DUF998 domain-containing protein [Tsukamurella sputi]TWS22867.1 DUF998 domain-containing protein [Tsukamurella sputi]